MIRPLITLSYAQSVDGSIAAAPGQPLTLSGPEAMKLTHELRASHDAILVGIGTVLADNPRLNVRLASGPQPQPVVLDSHLRFPLNANLLNHPKPPIIAAADHADAQLQAALELAGAKVIRFPTSDGGHVQLPALLAWLSQTGIKSLMVEGGSGVITSFLSARLVDRVIITIAPRFVGGLRAVSAPCDLALRNVTYRTLGADLIVEADTV
ncbi:MAG: dihydrofolate reductase family protein [Chloroflexi bacterium]|nr:dihydrofolate reductase family protein [Chloroflexota bacterium]